MKDDGVFRNYRIATYRYDSPLLGRTSTIQEVATRMLEQLEDNGVFRNYREIYFITHSMGGLVTKRAVVNLNNPPGIEKLRLIKAILYIATPAQGAAIADLGVWLSLNPQFRDMQSADFNSYLQDLEDDWANLTRQRGDQRFPLAFCAYEKKPLWGIVIVPRTSAFTYCDKNATAFDEDHVSIVKPANRQSQIYEWARGRIEEASELALGLPSTASIQKRREDELKRHEFLQARGKQIHSATFFVQFKHPYTPDELGHFRVLLEVSGQGTKDAGPASLSFAARDAYWLSQSAKGPVKRDGWRMDVWSRNPDLTFPRAIFEGGSATTGPSMAGIRISQEIDGKGPYQTIESFNRKDLSIFVSESLVDKIEGIGFAVDNYLLTGFPIDCLEPTKGTPVEWRFPLSQTERAIEWVNLLPKRYWPNDTSRPAFRPILVTNFERFTPERADSSGTWSVSPECELSKTEPLPPRQQ
jgi:hypothetical protein